MGKDGCSNGNGGDHTVRDFMIYAIHQVLFEWSNQEK